MSVKNRIEALITKLENWDYLESRTTSKEYLILCCGWKYKSEYSPYGHQVMKLEGPAGEPYRYAPWPTHVLQDALDSLPDDIIYEIRGHAHGPVTAKLKLSDKMSWGQGRPAVAICIANLRRVLLAETKTQAPE